MIMIGMLLEKNTQKHEQLSLFEKYMGTNRTGTRDNENQKRLRSVIIVPHGNNLNVLLENNTDEQNTLEELIPKSFGEGVGLPYLQQVSGIVLMCQTPLWKALHLLAQVFKRKSYRFWYAHWNPKLWQILSLKLRMLWGHRGSK